MTMFDAESDEGRISNPDVLDAMYELAEDDNPQSRERFYDSFINSMLLVPAKTVTAHSQDLRWQLDASGSTVEILLLEDEDGYVLMPVFTDEDALLMWAEDGSTYTAIPTEALCKMFMRHVGDAMLLNPAGPVSGTVTRREIEILSSGMQPRINHQRTVTDAQVRDDDEVLVRAARYVSPALMEGLADALTDHPEFTDCLLFEVMSPGQDIKLVAGIRFDPVIPQDQQHCMLEAFLDSVEGIVHNVRTVEFLIIDDDGLQSLRAITDPFYSRN